MEKKTPTYGLEEIRQEFCTLDGLRLTVTARRSVFALGFGLETVVLIVQSVKRAYFYKSMTSHGDHTVWQDVYRVPWEGLLLYVKFTVDEDGHLILSLKEV